MSLPFSPVFFKQLQQLKIKTRRSYLGLRQGSHRSPRRGHGLEFYQYRPYTMGDDFRHIDWGVYGRSDRLYLREFREEQNLNVLFLLDTSSSMFFPADSSKFELARNLAIALSYVALADGDTVMFSLLGERRSRRYGNKREIAAIFRDLSQVTPSGAIDFVSEIRAASSALKIPGKCFLISDFLFDSAEQFKALDILRSKNFEIVALQVLAPSEITLNAQGLDFVIDAETEEELELSLDASSIREYSLLLAAHIETLEKYCTKAGITYALVPSDESLEESILRRFPKMGILK